VTDHPVLIPTLEGPVGGIVSEPDGECRAALLLLGGYGRPARSGINSFWARLARRLAGIGALVLRVDYSREGETLPIGVGGSGQAWKRDLDMRILHQVVPWFRDQADGLPFLLAGACSGARFSIELAGADPHAFAGAFLVVPHIRPLQGEDSPPDATVDPFVARRLRVALAGGPIWILLGERDEEDVPELRRLLGPAAAELEVEAVPGVALHFLDQPAIQREAERRLLARVANALVAPRTAVP
jgi:dienelactone hydrolase